MNSKYSEDVEIETVKRVTPKLRCSIISISSEINTVRKTHFFQSILSTRIKISMIKMEKENKVIKKLSKDRSRSTPIIVIKILIGIFYPNKNIN